MFVKVTVARAGAATQNKERRQSFRDMRTLRSIEQDRTTSSRHMKELNSGFGTVKGGRKKEFPRKSGGHFTALEQALATGRRAAPRALRRPRPQSRAAIGASPAALLEAGPRRPRGRVPGRH